MQQRFRVLTGQTIAADGLVVASSATIDASASEGALSPAQVHPGTHVVRGTEVLDGRLIVETAEVGGGTHLINVDRIVRHARGQLPDVHRFSARHSYHSCSPRRACVFLSGCSSAATS
ncbi:P-type ATPase [Mycobacterium tilburgii]|uniref:P-type ATPase n=1 Tax=Mycobacterium tilburgii TaxID=44467 RepID=UPI0016427E8E